jgi:hypothetical protein
MDGIPETFIDRFGEVSFREGMVRIELVSLSSDEPRVIRRLIMSVQAFMQMQPVQRDMLERLQEAGVIRAVRATPEPESDSADPPDAAVEPVSWPRSATALPRSPNFDDA